MSRMAGWPSGGGGNATIGATTVGVAGPDSPCLGVIYHLPSAAAGSVTITWSTATAATAGGLVLAAGETTQLIPVPNLNAAKVWAGSGTITVNAMVFR